MSEPKTAAFAMQGARTAIASGLSHIEEQVTALEEAVVGNPAYAFDLAKTLIESTLRTILTDRNIQYSSKDDLPKLFTATSNALPFLPASANGNIAARNSLSQTLSGLKTAVLGVCTLRNACGFASHGSDGSKVTLESIQALLAAETADTIVGFFYNVHQQDRSPSTAIGKEPDADPEFDAYIDDQYPVIQIFEEDFAPSEVLFELAPEPYRLYLDEYRFDQTAEPQEMQAEEAADVQPVAVHQEEPK
jgi:hypothetical protein